MTGELFSGQGRFNSWLMPPTEGKSGNRSFTRGKSNDSSEKSSSLASNTFNEVNGEHGDIFGETAGSIAFGGVDSDTGVEFCADLFFGSDFGGGFDFGGGSDFGGGACFA